MSCARSELGPTTRFAASSEIPKHSQFSNVGWNADERKLVFTLFFFSHRLLRQPEAVLSNGRAGAPWQLAQHQSIFTPRSAFARDLEDDLPGRLFQGARTHSGFYLLLLRAVEGSL